MSTMKKRNTSITTKFKSKFGLKLKNQMQATGQLSDYKHQKTKIKSKLETKSNASTVTTILTSIFRWQHYYCWLSSLKMSLFNYYSPLYHKCCYRLDFLFKLNLYTVSFILLSLITLVRACSTTMKPVITSKESLESDLVVCLPANDTNNCTKYVNSSRNGLIELNEVLYPALKGFRGSYDYRMIARINPFWLTFEPPSDTSYYVMGVLYILTFVFGVTGNGLVIYMFARCKSLRTASNILVFNLAISDLLIVIKNPIAVYNNFMRGPALGDWGCRIYAFGGGFSGSASIAMLTVISMDRYSVVVNPLSSLRLNYKTKYYYFLILLAWMDALLFSSIPLLEVGLSVYVPEGYLTTCSFDYLDKSLNARIFMFSFFFFSWCVPLVIIAYCYFHILKVVTSSKDIQSNHNKHQVEVRLAFIVLLVIGFWFLAWTPYAIVAMSGVFGLERYLTPTRSMIPALFCKTAACLNPFLYTISHKRFRNELQRLFCKRRMVYGTSMTGTSFVTRTSRRIENRIELCNTDDQDKNPQNSIKSKVCMDNIAIGGVVNTALYGTGIEACSNVYRHHQIPQTCPKKSLHFKKDISPVVSSEDAGVYGLEVDDLNLDKSPETPAGETKF